MGFFDSFPKVFPHLFGFPWEEKVKRPPVSGPRPAPIVTPVRTLTITSPAQNAVFTSGQGATLSAVIVGTSQVNLPVQWYANNNPLASNYWMVDLPGTVSFFAEVQDPVYGRIASALRTVTVKAVNRQIEARAKFAVGDPVKYAGDQYIVRAVYPPGTYQDRYTFVYTIHVQDESAGLALGLPLEYAGVDESLLSKGQSRGSGSTALKVGDWVRVDYAGTQIQGTIDAVYADGTYSVNIPMWGTSIKVSRDQIKKF